MTATKSTPEPIAVIGSACRFAGGASNPSKLWELLKDPRDVLAENLDSRFSSDGFYHPNGSFHGHSNVKSSYLLEEDVRAFDAQFFNIKNVEAGAMDPQQRILMETVYEGLESAGLSIQKMRGSDTAVYAGNMCGDYENMVYRDLNAIPTYHGVGVGRSILSNRVSYFYDWHGPSMTLDTACSSSMYAVYLAAQALRAGESRAAVACGSNIILGPENYIFESKLNMLSPTSRSRMWDKGANGYARGEGVAAVILKTLSSAIADGDHIECIIREVGINQDGATNGITMPSASAQAALIHQTYARAGLNPLVATDRPQFFEAHGTGTPAGDPIEAEAINQAFFPGTRDGQNVGPAQDPLYVGSVKTVLGHTEGTAGVAALIKASLAVQHGVVPPNMLFNELNPDIIPFYHNVELPTTLKNWPALAPGQPRRASVNSFGFGGANSHAIIENYVPEQRLLTAADNSDEAPLGPYVFSAVSEQSLVANLESYAEYLAGPEGSALSPRDLAWTLRERRSTLPVKVALPAGSIEQLRTAIDAKLNDARTKSVDVGLRSVLPQTKPRILAVFTGQGAQYPRMGAELLDRSPEARRIVAELEAHLAALPQADRPSWSLEKEIRAAADTSRLSEAALSQPLCTVLQIVLVDLLRAAGVELAAAVGHSSGEIGAAYAAGLLSARDALLVAYYRGLHASKAASPNGAEIPGAMMAVGTSMEDAADVLADFAGAATLAACNSSASVTLSGDKDAIDELATIFEDEKKFNRKLKVDKAYHSGHMLPCSGPYIASLVNIDMKVQKPVGEGRPVWYSTVYEDLDMTSEAGLAKLRDGSYWSDNMVRPVLFYQGINKALASGSYDLALEIGPHPALKGPASQTIQETLNRDLPYQGVLARGTGADIALSNALGFLWCQESSLGSIVNLEAFETAATQSNGSAEKCTYRLIKGLPSYNWNHERTHWNESRRSRRLRTRKERPNVLLGNACPDSSVTQQRWRNVLKEREVPWLSGHQLQGRTVFPAAGYISTLLEAVRQLPQVEESNTKLIEITDFRIFQAMSFNEDDSGIEILVTLEEIRKDEARHSIQARFTYSSASGRDADSLILTATASVEILLGEPTADVLPARQAADPSCLIDVADDRFYDVMGELGYGYTGPFRALSGLRRKLSKAVAQVAIPPADDAILVHPGTLDGAIQAIVLAFCHPGDGQLWSLHVPTVIKHIRVNPSLCGAGWGDASSVHIAACTVEPNGPGLLGDVDIFSSGTEPEHAAIQIEGLRAVPFAGPSAADDDKIFAKIRWADGHANGDAMTEGSELSQYTRDLAVAAERMSIFYLRKFERELGPDHPARTDSTFRHYLHFGRHQNALLDQGRHKHARREWANDTWEDVVAATDRFKDTIDIRILRAVGDAMPAVFDGKETILQHLLPTGLLSEYYTDSIGLDDSAEWLGRGVKQLTHRYPQMNMLEVGAGTGGATKHIFKHIGAQGFGSYTYTDVSTGFFEEAATVFSKEKKRMIFKAFDAGRDPTTQGFVPGSYDCIVAFFVIHATPNLDLTLRNIRKLLRPGGFLVVGEWASTEFNRDGFVFGTFPGWWAGVDEGRVISPLVSPDRWDELLRGSGFSGIDTMTPELFPDAHAAGVFVSQAIDDTVNLLREPLVAAPSAVADVDSRPLEDLVIIGGASLRTMRAVSELKNILSSHVSGNISVYKTLKDLPSDYTTSPETCVLNISELDQPVFQDLSSGTFDALKRMLASEHTLMWVTRGRLADSPFANMGVSFLRTVVQEVPGLRVQCVDLDPSANGGRIDARELAETLLRFRYLSQISQDPSKGGEGGLMWSVEPEISIDADGHQLVSRFVPDGDANDRFNSARRAITHEVDVRETPVRVDKDDANVFTLHDVSKFSDATSGTTDNEQAKLTVRASSAVLSPVSTPLGPVYLSLGKQESAAAERTLFLSETLTSKSAVPSTIIAPAGDANSDDATLLVTVAANLIAKTILASALPGQKVGVHNATEALAQVLSKRAAENSVDLVFTTSFPVTEGSTAISIPTYKPAREIRQLLPQDLARFYIVAQGGSQNENILSALPYHCRVESLVVPSTVTQPIMPFSVHASAQLGDLLKEAVSHAQKDLATSASAPSVNVFSLTDLSSPDVATVHDSLAVVDWSAAAKVAARVSRLDDKPMFKSDKTYWLAGLSGSLGLSICDWMISKGAKNVVITSRNPKIDPQWLDDCKAKGANIKVLPNDISSAEDVEKVYKTITTTLPPLAGIMKGAMVLKDRLLRDMTFEDMRAVLGPKVDGTVHLDRILGYLPLDFFLFLSSMSQVLGNMGQSNYTAAGAFTSGLAIQRRKRGLAASVVDIGAVSGVGYIQREFGDAGDKNLLLAGLRRISEVAVHQMLAEGISVGYPHIPLGPNEEPEIGIGLRVISKSDVVLPRWHDNPKFAAYVAQDEESDNSGSGQANRASVQERLAAAQNKAQVAAAIQDSFLSKVRAIMQIEGVEDDALMRMRSDEIGMDSLIAVDLRSWFLKNLSVSIPVLKILSGVTISELVEEALQNVPAELTPNLGEGAADSSVPAASKTSIETPPRPASAASSSTPSMSEPRSGTISRASEETAPTPALMLPSEALKQLPPLKGEEIRPNPLDAALLSTTPFTVNQLDEILALPPVVAKPLTIQRSLNLSHTQSMFWVVHSLLEDKTTLNHTGYYRMTGPVRVADLEMAVRQVSLRHEGMRACFFVDDKKGNDNDGKTEDDGNPRVVQGILKTGIELEHKEIVSDAELEIEYSAVRDHVYDLSRGQFMRILLLTKADSPNDNYLIFGAHHINFDGMCTGVILRDLEAFYTRRARLTLSPTVRHYSDFITSQEKEEQDGGWESDFAFWRREFAVLPEPLPLTRARVAARKPLLRYDAHRADFRLDASLAERIRLVARQHRVTAFHFYLAAFRILLQRLLGLGAQAPGSSRSAIDNDICIGTADSGRRDEPTLASFGPYVNLLALRFRDSPRTFASALAGARDTTYAALAHASAPFDAVLQALRVPRDMSHAPLFQAFLDYRLGTRERQPFADCMLEAMRFEPGRTAYDLSVDIIDTPFYKDPSVEGGKGGGDAVLTVFGQTALYDAEDVQLFADCFQDLLVEFADNPTKSLRSGNWTYRDADTARALQLGRGPTFKPQWPGTLLHRLDYIVSGHADKVALKLAGSDETTSLTYQQLKAKTDAIAGALLAKGVRKGHHVAVYQEPSPSLVCSMLAIMRIGAVYVPLDPGNPTARLALVVNTCQPAALLVNSANNLTSTFDLDNVIDVSSVESSPAHDLPALPTINDPALALHTSGTTGTPKVIILTHSNLAHEVETSADTYGLDSNVTVLQQSALGFDMSVLQMFLALALGGTLVLAPREFRGDAVAMSDFIVQHKVTYTCATPTEYNSWLRHGDSEALRSSAWKVALSGGEVMDHSLLGAFREQLGSDSLLRLFNGYGPTETTCCSASSEVEFRFEPDDAQSSISAGPACFNEAIYILDEGMRLLPVGLPGEIFIGGVGVAAGYLGSDELTRRAFVPDPFASTGFKSNGWNTMYRTGDRGRLLLDGSLAIEGRIGDDTQIKLRGVRIDLRDIEQTIIRASDGAITAAIATTRSNSSSSSTGPESDSKFIIAHVVFSPEFLSEAEGNSNKPEEYLARLLPELALPRTVCPSMLIPIEKMPVTTSGKTDRRAVAALAIDRSSMEATRAEGQAEQTKPLNSTELTLRGIWEQVLCSQQAEPLEEPAPISCTTDFFHAGGTSMLLLDIRTQIKQRMGHSVSLMQLFEFSTLGAMACLLSGDSSGSYTKATPNIDWEFEATPWDELVKLAQVALSRAPSQRRSSSGPKTVVLTGAAGFVGRQVIERLLDAQRLGDVDTIICVAMRKVESRVAAGVLPPPSPGKLVYHEGDLRRPRLGLSGADWAAIAKQASAIVHVGADTSHTKTYSTLRDANVGSTGELARLCLEARLLQGTQVPIHFVSTTEVAMLNGGSDGPLKVLGENSVKAVGVVPSQVNAKANGYTATKWVSERLLENLSAVPAEAPTPTSEEDGRLRVWIHRTSIIVSPEDDAETQADGADIQILRSLFFYSRLLRAVPDVSDASWVGGSLDMITLDRVARDIVRAVVREGNEAAMGVTEGSVTHVHHVGEVVVNLTDVDRFLAGSDGASEPFEKVPLPAWIERAQAAGMNPLVAAMMKMVEEEKRPIYFPKFVKGTAF